MTTALSVLAALRKRNLAAIGDRLERPTPEQVKAARVAAGLTQADAAQLVSPALSKPYRTWQNYETPDSVSEHRPIPIGLWELFLLLTGQHPLLTTALKRPSSEN